MLVLKPLSIVKQKADPIMETNDGMSSNPVTNSGQTVSTATTATSSSSTSDRGYCCYIGNMAWWINDQDLQVHYIAHCLDTNCT